MLICMGVLFTWPCMLSQDLQQTILTTSIQRLPRGDYPAANDGVKVPWSNGSLARSYGSVTPQTFQRTGLLTLLLNRRATSDLAPSADLHRAKFLKPTTLTV